MNEAITMAKPFLEAAEFEAVAAVLKSGIIAQGARVAEFETAFAAFAGTRHAIAVNSGTAALHIALAAHGLGPGDEVITTPFSFIATGNSILFTGAKPVFVDIDDRDFNISAGEIEAKITPGTKAIMPVHLYGQPCEMDKVMAIAKKHNLAVIEDACQAHGAEYHGQKAGSFGTGCFSFYATKNITTGEGGMITTNDEHIAETARMLRNHGSQERYRHEMLGYNYRMTDVEAAIGICQLEKVAKLNSARIENAGRLTEGLDGIKGLILPVINKGVKHVFHQYTIRIAPDFPVSRAELRNRLKKENIGTEVYYPIPIHKQPFYQKLGYRDILPESERASAEALSLPVHPLVSMADIDRIVKAIKG